MTKDLAHHPAAFLTIYFLMAAALSLFVIPTWGWVYWDFGDGNYMYIARRVREGLVLYRDILAPQPPLHTFAGVVAQSFGEALFGSALIGVRIFCLLVRILAGLGILLLANRFFRCPFQALTAAGIYLTMPIGFWWSLGYQSENLENVFLIFALFFLISWEPKQAAIAGVLSALACHCNMTGVPFLLANAIFLAFRKPKLLIWYLGAAVPVYGAIAIGANIWTDGYFISNVLLNQVGTFPDSNILSFHNHGDNFWKYAVRKITTEGTKVLELEGGIILAAMIGAASFVVRISQKTSEGESERAEWLRVEFLAWQLIAGLLSICFVAKGGTVNYIFVLGEPAVALWAGTALVQLFRGFFPRDPQAWRTLSLFNTRTFLLALFPLLALGMIYRAPVKNIMLSLKQVQTELPEQEVLELRRFIMKHTSPGDTILSPPFYAFATDTIVAAELAENYIWQIKYKTEAFYNNPGEGVGKMRELEALINDRVPKVILLDMAQPGGVTFIRQAIARNYDEVTEEPIRTRNTTLRLYLPKPESDDQ